MTHMMMCRKPGSFIRVRPVPACETATLGDRPARAGSPLSGRVPLGAVNVRFSIWGDDTHRVQLRHPVLSVSKIDRGGALGLINAYAVFVDELATDAAAGVAARIRCYLVRNAVGKPS
jgi:hypothetical protein